MRVADAEMPDTVVPRELETAIGSCRQAASGNAVRINGDIRRGEGFAGNIVAHANPKLQEAGVGRGFEREWLMLLCAVRQKQAGLDETPVAFKWIPLDHRICRQVREGAVGPKLYPRAQPGPHARLINAWDAFRSRAARGATACTTENDQQAQKRNCSRKGPSAA